MITYVGNTFPESWIYGKYEIEIVEHLKKAISTAFPYQKNLLVNTTWFGPTFDNGEYAKALEHAGSVDNLFIVATVDPWYMSEPDQEYFIKKIAPKKVYKIGNFDNSDYEFNFFAPVIAKHFASYDNNDLLLKDIKYKFINYNRKPRFHRVELVKQILENKLDQYGIVTLGKPDRTYDQDPNNTLFLSIGEKVEDYVPYGHWFDTDQNDPTGIPHDMFSLHNWDAWQHHFLYVIGATLFYPWNDVFVTQDQFKPMIGLRPFVINGNNRTYKWLRNRGFKTFNHYFDFVDLEQDHEDSVHPSIIAILKWLTKTSNSDLLNMYNDMLPDLYHNKQRFYEYANEQDHKIKNMFR